jgi:hypothetical protein
MVSDSTRVDALRATGWIVGVVAGLSGLLGPVLAGGPDPTSLVGVVSGSGACVLAAFILDRQPANIVDIRMPPTHTDEGLRAAADLIRKIRSGTGERDQRLGWVSVPSRAGLTAVGAQAAGSTVTL